MQKPPALRRSSWMAAEPLGSLSSEGKQRVYCCSLWLTFACSSFIAAFCTFGAGSSFGVFQDFYTVQGTSSPSNISWIGSVQFFFTFAMGLPAGKLLDAGYFHHAQVCGAVLYVFS